MKENYRYRLSLILLSVILLAAGLFSACAGNHPIDESKLPDLEKPQEEQQIADQGQQEQPQEQQPPQEEQNTGSDAGSATEPLISEGEAMGIALARVPGASENDLVSFGKDYDDGRWIYEGEILYNGLEYDFEIDAQTGNILEWEIDD